MRYSSHLVSRGLCPLQLARSRARHSGARVSAEPTRSRVVFQRPGHDTKATGNDVGCLMSGDPPCNWPLRRGSEVPRHRLRSPWKRALLNKTPPGAFEVGPACYRLCQTRTARTEIGRGRRFGRSESCPAGSRTRFVLPEGRLRASRTPPGVGVPDALQACKCCATVAGAR